MKHLKWEYLTVEPPNQEELDKLGLAGWDLSGGTGGSPQKLIFKRPGLDFREQVTMEQRRKYFSLWGIDIDKLDGEQGE